MNFFVLFSLNRNFDFVEDRLHLGNTKKKRVFLWYFARFALSLQPEILNHDDYGSEETAIHIQARNVH